MTTTFSLANVRRTRSDLPPRTVVYGAHKVGKSTFAHGAPSPIVIQTEDGMDAIDGAAFPLCRSWADVLSCVGSLYSEAHEYQTVVIDSVDWAESLCHAAVCAEHEVKDLLLVRTHKLAAFPRPVRRLGPVLAGGPCRNSC